MPSSAPPAPPDPADRTLDCAGLLCPLPVLRARKVLLAMRPGQVLEVTATDRMAAIDLPHFCAEAGHDFLGSDTLGPGPQGDLSRYRIRRGPDRAAQD